MYLTDPSVKVSPWLAVCINVELLRFLQVAVLGLCYTRLDLACSRYYTYSRRRQQKQTMYSFAFPWRTWTLVHTDGTVLLALGFAGQSMVLEDTRAVPKRSVEA